MGGCFHAPLAILLETLVEGNYSLTSYKEVIKGASVVARVRSPRLTHEGKRGEAGLCTVQPAPYEHDAFCLHSMWPYGCHLVTVKENT